MVKAPEKFLGKGLSHRKGVAGKTGKKSAETYMRKISDEALARLKKNLQTIWSVYCAPEIKEEIFLKKRDGKFLNAEGPNVCFDISFMDKGILMEYELDMGHKKELAGARVYKQDKLFINRYFTSENGTEELLKTSNGALQAMVDVLTEREFSESDVRNAIEKCEQIHIAIL